MMIIRMTMAVNMLILSVGRPIKTFSSTVMAVAIPTR